MPTTAIICVLPVSSYSLFFLITPLSIPNYSFSFLFPTMLFSLLPTTPFSYFSLLFLSIPNYFLLLFLLFLTAPLGAFSASNACSAARPPGLERAAWLTRTTGWATWPSQKLLHTQARTRLILPLFLIFYFLFLTEIFCASHSFSDTATGRHVQYLLLLLALLHPLSFVTLWQLHFHILIVALF